MVVVVDVLAVVVAVVVVARSSSGCFEWRTIGTIMDEYLPLVAIIYDSMVLSSELLSST